MRLILNLAFALALVSGTATLTGCNTKKAETEHKTTDKTTTPGGGEKKTETKTETETTPPNK